MSLVRKILCPVDFSPCSVVALRYAAHFADALDGATMDVLHSYEYTTQLRPDLTAWINPTDADVIRTGAKEQAEAGMAAFLERIDADTRAHVGGVFIRFGEPDDEIVEFASTNKYDLIVMGTHGGTGLKHLILGSVTDKVVRQSPVPVLTVRDDTKTPDGGEEPPATSEY
jgi:universal stress protein A